MGCHYVVGLVAETELAEFLDDGQDMAGLAFSSLQRLPFPSTRAHFCGQEVVQGILIPCLSRGSVCQEVLLHFLPKPQFLAHVITYPGEAVRVLITGSDTL